MTNGPAWVRRLCVALLLASGAAAQTAPEKPYVERVEVNVRTVLVRITDKSGRVPSPPPEPADLAVFEDGVAVKVLGVDPASAGSPPPPDTPATGESAAASASTQGAPAPPPSLGIPQHLYVDVTLLDAGSVSCVAAAFGKNLPQILAYGTLEIVAADPQPRQILAPTRDGQLGRKALAELPSTVTGKQTLQFSRKRTMDSLRNGSCITPESSQLTIRSAAEQELRIAQSSLDRLLRWAASLGGQRPDVVYFVSDGFDSDPSESYGKVVIQKSAQPQTSLCQGINPQQAEVLSAQLRQGFAPQGAQWSEGRPSRWRRWESKPYPSLSKATPGTSEATPPHPERTRSFRRAERFRCSRGRWIRCAFWRTRPEARS